MIFYCCVLIVFMVLRGISTSTDTLSWLSDYMDSSINPCDNFHEFVCGKKNASTTESPKLTATYQGISMDFENDAIINKFIYLDPPGPHPLDQIRPFMTACLNEEHREQVGMTPVTSFLKKLNLTAAYIPDNFELAKILGKLYRNLGNLFLFNLKYMKPSQGKGILNLPPPYEHINVAEVGVTEYAKTMKSIMLPLASDLGISHKDSIDDNFYMNLVNIENIIYNKSEWQIAISGTLIYDRLEDHIDLPSFFNSLYEGLLGEQIESNLTTWTASRNHQDYFKKVLPTVLNQTKKYIVPYLQWRVLKWIGYDLTSDARIALYNLRRHPVKMGKQLCLESVFRLLPDVSLHRYLQQNSIDPLKKIEYSMNVNSQISLLFAIMSKRRMHALEMLKLKHALDLTVKFPTKRDFPRYKHESLFYQDLELSDDHLENVLLIRSISASNALKKLYGFPEYREWFSRPRFYFDSYYLSYESSPPTLYVPLGLLNEPYTGNNITVLDFAGMSFVIFEARVRNGLRYITDSDGLELWKSPFHEAVKVGNQELLKSLEQTLNCQSILFENITESRFPGKKLNMNSSKIRRDMFIDGAALELTLDSFERHMTIKGLRNNYYTIEGSKYNLLQLFYMHLTRLSCDENLMSETWLNKALEHGPIPNSLRTNSMLRNLGKFSKVWNCLPNSFMNPSNKCMFFDLYFFDTFIFAN